MKYKVIAAVLLTFAVTALASTPFYVGQEWTSGSGAVTDTLDVLNHSNNVGGEPTRIYTLGSIGGTTTFTLIFREQVSSTGMRVTITAPDGFSFSSLSKDMPRVDSVIVARANTSVHAYFHAWAER